MRKKILFCAYAALILAAYLQPLPPVLFDPRYHNTLTPSITIMLLTAWAAPTVPALLGYFALMGMRFIPSLLAKTLIGLCIVIGLFLTLASGVLSLFSDTQILHGVTLTIAVASSFRVWASNKGNAQSFSLMNAGIAVSTIAALWSLFTVPMILTQARNISEGFPYCIAHHVPNSEVNKLSELRGFSFYTDDTGNKSTSSWFFHGVMIVDFPEGQYFYNWSPRRWRFDQINNPDSLFEPVNDVCVPS